MVIHHAGMESHIKCGEAHQMAMHRLPDWLATPMHCVNHLSAKTMTKFATISLTNNVQIMKEATEIFLNLYDDWFSARIFLL